MATTASPADCSAIIVASANPLFRQRMIQTLRTPADCIEEAVGGAEALGKLDQRSCRLLLLDRNLPDLTCEEISQIVGNSHPGVTVQVVDGDQAEIPHRQPESSFFRSARFAPSPECRQGPDSHSDPSFPGLVGRSSEMERVKNMVRRVASRDTTVLLTGESGTGKEVVAAAIHRLSPRRGRPFVTVNCAAIPEALLESELFGYARGAFTGAVQSRIGKIQGAQYGTLFLDEIGEMPVGLQAKLLRFLESREIQRLGSSDVYQVDVRVIAATNANLPIRVAEKSFREDLYYRLAVFPIELPPLRSRGDDVLSLARHFLARFCGEYAELSPEAEQWLASQPWRGNVRELLHAIERAGILWEGAGPVTVHHLAPS